MGVQRRAVDEQNPKGLHYSTANSLGRPPETPPPKKRLWVGLRSVDQSFPPRLRKGEK